MGRHAWLVALLWLALTVVVWNAVYERIVITEGRAYVAAALEADRAAAPALRIDDWMPAAVRRAFWTATGAGAVLACAGVAVVLLVHARVGLAPRDDRR
jgi:hypothetical protein